MKLRVSIWRFWLSGEGSNSIIILPPKTHTLIISSFPPGPALGTRGKGENISNTLTPKNETRKKKTISKLTHPHHSGCFQKSKQGIVRTNASHSSPSSTIKESRVRTLLLPPLQEVDVYPPKILCAILPSFLP